MKINLNIILLFLLLTSCLQNKEIEEKNTFSLKKIDAAIIYEKKIKNIPCLLFNVTDTIKSNRRIGIIFKLDLNYDNQRKGSIEPGIDGTNEKIKDIKIIFKSDRTEIDVTDRLFNIEEAQMFNRFENYIQHQFKTNDYDCVCYEEKSNELIRNLNSFHLGGKLKRSKIDRKRTPIIKNINDFVNFYNSFTGVKYNGSFDNLELVNSGFKISGYYFYFWLPDNLIGSSEKFKTLEIDVELLKGRKLKSLRALK